MLRDLAESGEMFLEDRGDPGKAVGKLAGAHERRAARRRDRAQEAGDHLGPRPEAGGSRVPRQRVVGAEDLGGDVGIGRAADVEQQARVVRLRRRLRIDAQTVGKPHREQRAVQPVLERHPDAEVRRQRERGDHLRSADGPDLRRCARRHAADSNQAAAPSISSRASQPVESGCRRRLPPTQGAGRTGSRAGR